jgi:phosphoribosylglycinamide formyltransferase 1
LNRPARLAVFASGGGTNLQALLDYFNASGSPVARVEVVIASRPGIGALERAEVAEVPWRVIDPELEPSILATTTLAELGDRRIDIVVLAGYLRLIPPEVVARYHGRIVNIHPALLPSFGGPGMYGIRVHRAVLAAGARVSGASVHLVDERYDEGPILAQWPVPVYPSDTPETLAARILPVEHLLLPAAIEHLVRGDTMAAADSAPTFELTDAAAPSPEKVRRFVFDGAGPGGRKG